MRARVTLMPTGSSPLRTRHALRHRPDHIVVGEVRVGEAADVLQALNTGHGGSLTTVHVVDGIALVIHMTRVDGRRVVEEATFVNGYDAGTNQWDAQRVDRVTV